MADFYAVESGNSSTGYIVTNSGNVYPAVSGAGNRLDIPAGNYTHGDGIVPRADEPTMTDGTGRKKFRKFHIWGTGPEGWIKDPRYPGGWRKGIEFHYDGGNPGTAGCIGYQDPAAKNDLIAEGDGASVHVEYLQNQDAVKAAIERKLGHTVDWSKIKPPKAPGSGGGAHSHTRKGHKVKKASHTVAAGPKKRQTAHRHAELEGGALVAEGSSSVFVEPEQYAVAGVDHQTTDGSPLAIGEDTVLFT